MPALSSRDPEVRWRLADVLIAQGRYRRGRGAARRRTVGLRGASWETPARLRGPCRGVLRRQRRRCRRALELARANVANRPTRRAFEQAHAIAVAAGEADAAAKLLTACTSRWGHTPAFRLSSLAQHRNNREGVAA